MILSIFVYILKAKQEALCFSQYLLFFIGRKPQVFNLDLLINLIKAQVEPHESPEQRDFEQKSSADEREAYKGTPSEDTRIE